MLRRFALPASRLKFTFLICSLLSADAFLPASAQTAQPGGLTTVTSPYSFGIAADANGNVYTTNFGTGVYKGVIVNGAYNPTLIINALGSASGIAVDRGDNLYVQDVAYKRLVKETPQSNGTYVATTINTFTSTNVGVAVDTAGNVYATTYTALYKFTLGSNGSYSVPIPISTATFQQAGNVTIDTAGNLYLCDSYGSAIYKYTGSGNVYTETKLKVPGLNFPESASADAFGNLYIVSPAYVSGNSSPGGLLKATLNSPSTSTARPSPTAQVRSH